MTPPIIDTHAHIIPPDMLSVILRDGAHYGVEIEGHDKLRTVRLAGSSYTRPMPAFLSNVTERIETMDRQGVDVQVLAGWVDFSGYSMPLDLGIKFSELQNDSIAAVVAAKPDRYVGAANVPLQDAKAAVKVLERAVTLHGFKAAQISPYLGGERFLDDPALDPFWQAAQEMKVLLLFHPYDEARPAGLDDFFLHNCIGYPLQTTIAVVRMMFGGVFTRFPDLLLKLPHAGGFLPYQIERFRHAADFRPEPRSKGFSGDPLAILKRLYFDTVTFSPKTLRYLADLVGAERLMLGSDYPFEMGDADPVATVKTAFPEDASQCAVLGGNAQRLLCHGRDCGCHGRGGSSSRGQR
jgi:aminocarboxymuconate-semialdehyde decarboxylase